MNEKTIQYYDKNAEMFIAGTEHADMSEQRSRFLCYLKPGNRVLDAGCGSGRDALAFLSEGYQADAFDASEEICRIAAARTGIPVKKQRFETLEGEAEYDGIWACASLLHVQKEDLPDVMKRLYRMLKPQGVLYASFKYETAGECIKEGRYFCNLDEMQCRKLFIDAGFEIRELFITADVRTDRGGEKWVNVIGQKDTHK